MKFVKPVAALSLVLIFSVAAFAQPDAKTQEKLDEIAGKVESISSYRVDMEMKMSMMGQDMITKGEMTFKKPDKMHMKTTSDMMGGMTQEIFTSGDIVWTYSPMMNMATKMDMSKLRAAGQDQPGMADNADITKPFEGFPKDKVKFIETKETEEGSVYVFEAKPDLKGNMSSGQPIPPMFPEKIVFWIMTDTGLPSKVTMLAEDGSTLSEQTYSNFRLNVDIEDSEFEFTAPEGVQIMDMTEGAINFMKQMEGSQPKTEE